MTAGPVVHSAEAATHCSSSSSIEAQHCLAPVRQSLLDHVLATVLHTLRFAIRCCICIAATTDYGVLLLLVLLQKCAAWALPTLLGVPCCTGLAGLGPRAN
jgi:hypothetical protein